VEESYGFRALSSRCLDGCSVNLLQGYSTKTDQRVILRSIKVLEAEFKRPWLCAETEGPKETIPKREKRSVVESVSGCHRE
jgi:hypothetical protein